MAREAAAWSEGYRTAMLDFKVVPTDATMLGATKNPYTTEDNERRMSALEIVEVRNALSYGFRDDPDEWAIQAEIMLTIVERILSRRPGRGA